MGQLIERHRRQKPTGLPAMAGAALYLLDRALMVAAAAVGVAIFYLLQGLISGATAAFPNSVNGEPLPAGVQQQFLHGIHVASFIFMGCMWGITLISIFRFRENDVAGYVGGLGGLLCYFAFPWLVRTALMQHNADPNAASDLLLASFGVTGKVLLLITIVYFASKMTVRLVHRTTRPARASAAPIIIEGDEDKRPAEKRPPRRSATRKCWELSMCRDSLRENCPSYKLGVACWKRGTGCQCDPLLAQRLIEDLERKLDGSLPEKERVARERMKEQLSYQLTEHPGESFCRSCPVYNEHQYYKYKALFWIAYPITAGLLMLVLPLIHRAYRWVDVSLGQMLGGLQMLPQTDDVLRPWVNTVYTFNAEFIFIISAALIIAAYLLDALDYAVFQAKI